MSRYCSMPFDCLDKLAGGTHSSWSLTTPLPPVGGDPSALTWMISGPDVSWQHAAQNNMPPASGGLSARASYAIPESKGGEQGTA